MSDRGVIIRWCMYAMLCAAIISSALQMIHTQSLTLRIKVMIKWDSCEHSYI